MEQAPKCSCGNQSVKKEFATFKFYYCAACKIEVGQGTPVKPITPLWDWDSKKPLPEVNLNKPTPGALPKGYVALSGEAVTCSFCGEEHGHLTQDLPSTAYIGHQGVPSRSFSGTGTYVAFNPVGVCCPNMCFDKYDPWTSFTMIHIKGRGWV